jgi:hypothetical protein
LRHGEENKMKRKKEFPAAKREGGEEAERKSEASVRNKILREARKNLNPPI